MRKRRGPIRSEAAQTAILDATAKIFTDHGYDQLTIEGIAAAAGVGKQTIYRWWGSKSAVVADCLISGRLLPERLALPDTGDVRRDLVNWLTGVIEVLDTPNSRDLLHSLVTAATDNVEIARRLRESLLGEESIAGRLEAASDTVPNLYPEAPFDVLAEALIGVIILRSLSEAPLDQPAAERLVDALLGVRPS